MTTAARRAPGSTDARPDRPSPASAARAGAPRAEAVVAAALLAVGFALRIVYAARLSVDTDEPQHLHVAWALTRAWVPYRDFFDNHTPLFHVLAAPLVAAIGERPDLLLWMRLALVPLVAFVLWATYRIGADLFSPRTGLWAAAAVGILPGFFVASVQFRADALWTALWMACLALWAGGGLRPPRAFCLGLLVGATFATSLKTTLLVATFAAAWLLAPILDPARAPVRRGPGWWRSLGALAAGTGLVAALVVGSFAVLGALPQFLDCVFTHNVAAVSLWRHRMLRVLAFVAALPLLCWVARRMLAHSPSSALGRRRAVLFLSTTLYFMTLNSFWPLIPRQDFLPFYPPLVVLLTAAALEQPYRLPAIRPGPALLALFGAAEIAVVCWAAPPWRSGTAFEIGLVADVLRLTRPSDPVMDLKGESLFRPRPTYWVLENITEERMRRGEIPDDLARRLVETRTYVAVVDSPRFPPKARRFLLDNYIPVGHLRVAGQFLHAGASGVYAFDLALPGRYSVLSPRGQVTGTLDGSAFAGPRELAAGRHVLRADATPPLALVWADAAEKGFSPFHAEPPPPEDPA